MTTACNQPAENTASAKTPTATTTPTPPAASQNAHRPIGTNTQVKISAPRGTPSAPPSTMPTPQSTAWPPTAQEAHELLSLLNGYRLNTSQAYNMGIISATAAKYTLADIAAGEAVLRRYAQNQQGVHYSFRCYSCAKRWERRSPTSNCPKCGTTNAFSAADVCSQRETGEGRCRFFGGQRVQLKWLDGRKLPEPTGVILRATATTAIAAFNEHPGCGLDATQKFTKRKCGEFIAAGWHWELGIPSIKEI